MSDPVTNVEIEDVLSSIRRLVSEEGRPQKGASQSPPERLVLSPSLRVPDAPKPADMDKPPETANDGAEAPMLLTTVVVPDPDDAPEPSPQLSDAIREATRIIDAEEGGGPDPKDAVEASDIEDWSLTRIAEPVDESEESDAPIEADQSTVVKEADDTSELSDLRAELTDLLSPEETDVLEEAETQDDPEEARDLGLEDKIATLEKMLHRQSEDWEPAPLNARDSALPEDDALSDEFESDEASVDPSDVDDPVVLVDPALDVSTPVESEDEAESAPIDKIETEETPLAEEAGPALESALSEALEGAPEAEDAAEEEDIAAFVRHAASESLDWEDHETEEVAETATPSETAPMAKARSTTALADIDEAALQDLVSELVRKELQGVLGERITRNVRKLVRREIHRVIMSQDLD